MNTKLSGSCLCGAVEFTILGEIEEFYLCHCSRCQKATGTAHASNLATKRAQLIWDNGQAAVNTYRVPESLFTRNFCQQCGSGLPAFEEDLLVIPAGAINSDIEIKPTMHIYHADKANWEQGFDAIKSYNQMPDD